MRLLFTALGGLGLVTGVLAQAQSMPGVRTHVAGEDPLLLRLETQAEGPFGGFPGTMSLAADDTGNVWLTLPRGGPALARFGRGKWRVVKPAGFADSLRASQLLRLANGRVACLWKDVGRSEAWVLSQHRGEEHSNWCYLELKCEQPRLLPLADGGVLITEAGRSVLRIRPDRTVERFELPESLFIAPKKNDDGSTSDTRVHVQVHAVQDKRGKIWLWSYAMKPLEYQWRLRGLVRLEDGSFQPEKLGDIDGATPLSAIVPWEAGTLAVAVSGRGLFQFDSVRQSARQIEIQSDELKHIEKIFRAHGDWHFITTPRPPETRIEVSKTFSGTMVLHTHRFHDPEKRSTAILRFRQKKLEVITWKLDAEAEFGWADRPVVETPEGFWTCAKDSGLLFITQEEGVLARRPFDWRNGLPLPAPRLLAKAGDYLVAADALSSSAIAITAKAPSPLPVPSRVDVVESSSLLLEDTQGGFFGVLQDGKFHRWKAGHWEKMQGPAHMDAMAGNELVEDGGQAWFIPRADGLAAVCDLATGEWQEFDSLEQALEARLKPGGRMLPPNYLFPSAIASAAGQDRRIGFLRHTGTLHLFDSGGWRTWRLSDIAGPDARIDAVLRFDAAGALAAPIGSVWWKLDASGQWRRTEESTEGAEPLHDRRGPVVPEGCPVKEVVTAAYDRLGVCWLTDNQHLLWKCVHGAAVPVLQPGEINPVAQGLSLEQALLDAEGNAFLTVHTRGDDRRYLIVRPRLPQPESKAGLKEVDADTVRFEFGDASWHAWRVDGGKWSTATRQKAAALSSLTPGVHELEVMAYNDDLTPAPRPATLKLTIRAADQGDVAKAIAAFNSEDLEACEVAARRLRTQGKPILPLLRDARKPADERARWWLDAVIQHLETKSETQ
ncbi:MAG: hypothetical protein ACO1TE_02090 [Prosthecobacter sp.]